MTEKPKADRDLQTPDSADETVRGIFVPETEVEQSEADDDRFPKTGQDASSGGPGGGSN